MERRLMYADSNPRLFWPVVAIAFVAVIGGYAADWLNGGAFAGALGLLAAIALTGPRPRRR